MTKEIEEKIENNEYKIMELWDLICSDVGFDRKGKEIQADIRKFVELKLAKQEFDLVKRHSQLAGKVLREEKQKWVEDLKYGKICLNCGGKKKGKLTDLCDKCLEEI